MDDAHPAAPAAAFPFYLDGPDGERFGAEPTEHDGEPAVRLVALALPLHVEREGHTPVAADLAGAEGVVSVETVRRRYFDALTWTIRAGTPGPVPSSAAARAAGEALARLAPMPPRAPDRHAPDPNAPGGYAPGRRLAELDA